MMMISAFPGTCEGCYVYAALTMHFAMKIDNYKLLATESYLSGDMNCNLQVDELKVTKSVSASFSKLIMTYVSAVVPIKHEVGLATLSISATVPMCIGMDFDASTTATFEAVYTATASAKAGMKWDKASNNTQIVNKVDVAYGGKGFRPISLA
eukprot:16496-Heterococcus_DN1.PRE.1